MAAEGDARTLEASLQASWDAETATVYADLLTGRGDPRGELIALDLAIARGWSRELDDQRRAKLFAWLGGETICDRRWHPRQFRYGLLDELTVFADAKHTERAVLDAVLASPAGNVVRGLRLHGGDLASCFAALAAHGMPWLRRLAIWRQGTAALSHRELAAIFEATPNLDELSLDGPQLLASPGHPNVTTLRITGAESLVITASPMTWITTLDLALADPESWQPVAEGTAAALAPLVNPRTFPALRTLDLARNEARRYTAGAQSSDLLFEFLDAVEHLDRFAIVRLPSIQTDESAARTLALLARCPTLEVEIARAYDVRPELRGHPRLRVPEPRVWPVPGVVHGRDALTVKAPGMPYGDQLALSSLVRDLEAQFDAMPPHAQAAWRAVWDFLDGLGWEDEAGKDIVLPFDGHTLLDALDALDGNHRGDTVAAMIRAAQLAPEAEVSIKRYWGW